jgi:hypothetical protein
VKSESLTGASLKNRKMADRKMKTIAISLSAIFLFFRHTLRLLPTAAFFLDALILEALYFGEFARRVRAPPALLIGAGEQEARV